MDNAYELYLLLKSCQRNEDSKEYEKALINEFKKGSSEDYIKKGIDLNKFIVMKKIETVEDAKKNYDIINRIFVINKTLINALNTNKALYLLSIPKNFYDKSKKIVLDDAEKVDQLIEMIQNLPKASERIYYSDNIKVNPLKILSNDTFLYNGNDKNQLTFTSQDFKLYEEFKEESFEKIVGFRHKSYVFGSNQLNQALTKSITDHNLFVFRKSNRISVYSNIFLQLFLILSLISMIYMKYLSNNPIGSLSAIYLIPIAIIVFILTHLMRGKYVLTTTNRRELGVFLIALTTLAVYYILITDQLILLGFDQLFIFTSYLLLTIWLTKIKSVKSNYLMRKFSLSVLCFLFTFILFFIPIQFWYIILIFSSSTILGLLGGVSK